MKKAFLFALLSLLGSACTPEARPIEYGVDACDFCRMTIVDKRYAAEVVTAKGRAYKFDAAECLLRYVGQRDEDGFALLLVTTYTNPGILTGARKATYLISPALPSPMGANLTAFATESDALAMQEEKGGRLYDWNELRTLFK